MTQDRLHSFDAVEDSVESLFAQHGRDRAAVYWIFLIVACCALAALPIVNVEVSVGAAGIVRPVLERVPVTTPVEGYIKRLEVGENKRVRQGDILLVIESNVLEQKLLYNKREQEENLAELTDLALAIKAASGISEAGGDEPHHDAGLLEKGAGDFRTAAYFRQFQLFTSKVAANGVQLQKSLREQGRQNLLYKKGLATDQDLEQSRYSVESLRAERGELIRQTVSQWQSDRRDAESKQLGLEAEARQLEQQHDLSVVRAPVDGTAVGFTSLSAGTYLLAGSKLGEISPDGDLQVEAYIQPKDIGFVSNGQKANIQVDSFPYSHWGMLRATVKDISRDVMQAGQQPAFKVLLVMDALHLRSSNGTVVTVTKGMTVNVRFIVGRRTLWSLLREDTGQWLDPSGKSS